MNGTVGLVVSVIFFVGIHLGLAGTGLRGRLIGAIGEGPYRGLFSLLSAIGLAGIIWFFDPYGADNVAFWGPMMVTRWLAVVLMLPAFILFVCAFTMKSPTVIGQEGAADAGAAAAVGILRVTRHPFLWAVVLWATVHVLNNGDVVSLVLFLGMLVLALTGPAQIDRRKAEAKGAGWISFAAVTSNVPFGAILDGRNNFSLREIGWWRIAVGVLLWAGLLHAHGKVFGVPALVFG
ncbi:NnrU family protein [Oleomonas cavernae]|uniref:NnrU family protein n=1 Tax=Oleomonas cavernae TaxID=2320859 RepID=A0A418VTN5_9PROT|nr:NnrU family protein [Oleomonas cavernae]RJF80494.1 NnrU family protein [Oleomonas cavernae]